LLFEHLGTSRNFLMRLIAKHGPRGAARVLRALADELDGLSAENLPHFCHSTEQEQALRTATDSKPDL
jgi:hypothetical protein